MNLMADENGIPVRKKVVLVDDDADFGALVRMMLAGGDLDLITVEEGTSAMAAIREHQPDVVILDLMLPDMNGWEIFMAMRAEAVSAPIPVIILSCMGTRHDRSFGLQVARVHDYLVKPCLPSRLRASVNAAIGGGAAALARATPNLAGRALALQN
jgi:two-component system OmpR family response regulator